MACAVCTVRIGLLLETAGCDGRLHRDADAETQMFSSCISAHNLQHDGCMNRMDCCSAVVLLCVWWCDEMVCESYCLTIGLVVEEL
jgi:hypothetical protein